MAKAERLVNLVALLLATRRPLTLDQITEVVPGYDADGEALRRMFERDKDELRKLGVPIERGPVDPWGGDEGYFIDPTSYAMPDLELAQDERAALALAAQVWAGGRAGQPMRAKLDLDPGVRPLQADLQGSSPVVVAILDALESRRRITFTYRPPRRDAARRQLDPYALVHRRGTWYVAGRDPDRDALRCFRLSRIESEVKPARPGARGPEFSVPGDFDPGASIGIPTAGEPDEQRPVVVVRVAAPAARLAVLRGAERVDEPRAPRGASEAGAGAGAPTGPASEPGGPGGGDEPLVTIRLRLANPDMFVAWALANQASVVEPADLAAELEQRRSALAERLARAAEPVALPATDGQDAAGSRPGRRTPTAAGRVERLLALVPWVLAHPGASVTDVCAHFAIDRQTLLADLDLLFVSGLPPYGPGDLIEAWVDGDRIHIDLADYFARAPRLTWRETVGLYLAARALATVPGFDQHDALVRARKRLEASLPSDQLRRLLDVAGRVEVDLEGDPVERRHLPVLTQAAERRTRVELEYYSSSRTEHTRRLVDPWALFPASGHWYLTGWCHLAKAERLFRVDRMLSVSPTPEPFEVPAGFDPASARRLPQSFTPGGVACAIAVDADAEWVATVMPVQGTARLPDGRLLVRLAAQELSWAARLVVRLAPAAIPLDPPELRAAVARLLQAS